MSDDDGGEFPWRERTRRLLQVGAPPDTPLAEIAVLRSRPRDQSDLIFAVHHGIADGRSAITLLDELLEEYASLEAHLPLAPVQERSIVSAARAVPSGGWLGRLRLARRFAGLQLAERRLTATALPVADGVPDLSQWVHWVLSPSDTVRLVRRCRKEQVSLGGALIAAVCCGLIDCLPTPEARFKWHTAFDVRDILENPGTPVAPNDVGCFMSLMRGFCSVAQQPAFWDVARRIDREIQEFARNGGPAVGYNMSAVGLKPVVTRVEPTLLRSASRRPTLFVTTYGVLELRDAYGPLRPRECTLAFIGDELTRPWLTVEALVLGRRMNIGFVADGLEPAFWDRLRAAVRRRVHAAVGGENGEGACDAAERSGAQAAPHRMSVAPHE